MGIAARSASSANSCVHFQQSTIESSAVVVERDGHFDHSALAWSAGDCELTADSFEALAHVRQPVAAALSGRRIETDSVIGDFDLKFGRLGTDFELDFGGFCMFDGVVERFPEGQEELVADIGWDGTVGQFRGEFYTGANVGVFEEIVGGL